MKKTYHFKCIDKFSLVRATTNIDADSADEAQLKAEKWCSEYLRGEPGYQTQRVSE
jgi:hypothetical protein